MSFYFGNIIVKSVNKVKTKYKYAKTQYAIFEQELKNNKFNNYDKKIPDQIKTNPFYWGNLIKTKLYESLKFLFENLKNKPKLLTQENSNNIPIHLKNYANNLTNYSKQTAISILESTNKLILKVTFGYLDIRKISNSALVPVFKNFYLTISKNISAQNILIFYKTMGNKINKFNQETMKNISKYRDSKMYDEFKRNYDNYFRSMNEKVKYNNQNNDANKSKSFLRKNFQYFYARITSLGYSRSTIEKKVNKINDYINSPWYKQKILNYQSKFKNIWKERNKPGGILNYSYYKEKVNSKNITKIWESFSYTNAQKIVKGGFKRQVRKILLYIFSFFMVYYSIKYFLYRVFNRKNDKNLEDALQAVKELKMQNEELMKYNRDLIDKIIDKKK